MTSLPVGVEADAMRCPRCKDDNDRVVDSRTSAEGTVIRRRRECLSCFLRYTTYERIEETTLRVVKKSGERVSFDRERVLTGMLRACEKLPVPVEELEMACARIEVRIMEEFDREVPSLVVGSLVMEELRGLDQVAYVRFASVYREFRDVSQFLEELRPMMTGGLGNITIKKTTKKATKKTTKKGAKKAAKKSTKKAAKKSKKRGGKG